MLTEHDLTVVIRSSSERTEEYCRQRVIENGVSHEQIHVIHEVPFSKAMEVSYQLGKEAGRPWTYCLDADVILREGAISQLLKLAEEEKEDLFGLSGKLLDKLFGKERSVGNHLFRTTFLPKMICEIANFHDEQIRPETEVKNQMRAMGFRWEKKPILIGLHDFEQHPHDIARKAYVHIHKHTEELSELIGFWIKKQEEDPDFEIALYAASQSLLRRDRLRIDTRIFRELEDKIKEQFSEKSELIHLSGERIEKLIEDGSVRYSPSLKLVKKQEDSFYQYFYKQRNVVLLKVFLKKIKKELRASLIT